MTLAEIKNQLATSGLPVVYYEWPKNKAPALPYLCYLQGSTNNLHADGGVYKKIATVTVELYSREKDPAAEAAVEKALAPYHWETTGSEYIDTERVYETIYEFEVIFDA